MKDINEFIINIKNNMDKLEKDFEIVCGDLDTLDKNYTVAKSQLQSKKEQIRGAYSILNDQYTQLVGNDNNMTPENAVDKIEKKSTKKVEDKKVAILKSEEKKVKETPSDKLTPDQISKLKQVIPNKTIQKDNSNDDIPEYLRDEYKKLK